MLAWRPLGVGTGQASELQEGIDDETPLVGRPGGIGRDDSGCVTAADSAASAMKRLGMSPLYIKTSSSRARVNAT